MHVLWTCNANLVFWRFVLDVCSGAPVPSPSEIETAIWEDPSENTPILELGSDADPAIRRLIEQYCYARTGLNILLCKLDDIGGGWPEQLRIGFRSSGNQPAPLSLHEFLMHVVAHRTQVDATDAGRWLKLEVANLFDKHRELRTLASCRSGYSKNLFEFARYTLGQAERKDVEQRTYDLAYLVSFAGKRKPQLVQPGPDMLLMLVHSCCARNPAIPSSLDEFRRHLAEYGLHAPAGELIDGLTGQSLAMLGLVVDSPDAAGGRVLVRPF
jgi:hypothetical protein